MCTIIQQQHHLVHDTETTLNQMVQQSLQAGKREQQLTETSEQVCIVHDLVIVLLIVVLFY